MENVDFRVKLISVQTNNIVQHRLRTGILE